MPSGRAGRPGSAGWWDRPGARPPWPGRSPTPPGPPASDSGLAMPPVPRSSRDGDGLAGDGQRSSARRPDRRVRVGWRRGGPGVGGRSTIATPRYRRGRRRPGHRPAADRRRLPAGGGGHDLDPVAVGDQRCASQALFGTTSPLRATAMPRGEGHQADTSSATVTAGRAVPGSPVDRRRRSSARPGTRRPSPGTAAEPPVGANRPGPNGGEPARGPSRRPEPRHAAGGPTRRRGCRPPRRR